MRAARRRQVDDEIALLLSDVLPTGHEIGVQYGDVKPGDTVFIAGAGPVGMGVLVTAQFYSPSVIIVCDMDEDRLKMAREMAEKDPRAVAMVIRSWMEKQHGKS